MSNNNKAPLENAGLSVEEKPFFSHARPQAYQPYSTKAIEDFANWARAKSLWILAFGTGCCSIELRPLMTSRFDANRFGVAGRPTPRQSSVFVIGGYVSVKTLKRIIRSYEQMQGPKFIIALGSCPANGGMYFDSYNTINQFDLYLPVDMYVTGCMPRPEALLASIMDMQDDIRAGKCDGANHYVNNLDWYKKNQKKVIKNWDMPDYNW